MNPQIYKVITQEKNQLVVTSDRYVIGYELANRIDELKVGDIFTYDKVLFFKITKKYEDIFSFECVSIYMTL